MTDFANEMSGLSKQSRRLRHSKNEYRVYLALIFFGRFAVLHRDLGLSPDPAHDAAHAGSGSKRDQRGAHHHTTYFPNVGKRFSAPNGPGSKIRSSAWGSGIKAGGVPLL